MKIGDVVVLPAIPRDGRWLSVHVEVIDEGYDWVGVIFNGEKKYLWKKEVAFIKEDIWE